jgi:hypothetical protein
VLLCSRFIWFCTNTWPPWEADHAPSRSQSHRPAPRGPSRSLAGSNPHHVGGVLLARPWRSRASTLSSSSCCSAPSPRFPRKLPGEAAVVRQVSPFSPSPLCDVVRELRSVSLLSSVLEWLDWCQLGSSETPDPVARFTFVGLCFS